MNYRPASLFLLFVIFLICSVSTGKAQSSKAISFVEAYAGVAFWVVDGRKQPLVKWNKDTLRYKVAGHQDFISDKDWEKFLSEVSSLTGITFLSADSEEYEILVYFGSLNQYAALTGSHIPPNARGKFNNWTNRKWDKDYHLTKASLCVVTSMVVDRPYLGELQLKKSFIRCLGILGETENQYSLLFLQPSPSNTDMTRDDKRMVKLHYSAIVQAGMSPAEVKSALLNLDYIDDLAKEKL